MMVLGISHGISGLKPKRWSRIPTSVGGSGGDARRGEGEAEAAETYMCVTPKD